MVSFVRKLLLIGKGLTVFQNALLLTKPFPVTLRKYAFLTDLVNHKTFLLISRPKRNLLGDQVIVLYFFEYFPKKGSMLLSFNVAISKHDELQRKKK